MEVTHTLLCGAEGIQRLWYRALSTSDVSSSGQSGTVPQHNQILNRTFRISNCAKSRQEPWKGLGRLTSLTRTPDLGTALHLGGHSLQGPPSHGKGSPNRALLTDPADRCKDEVSGSPFRQISAVQVKISRHRCKALPVNALSRAIWRTLGRIGQHLSDLATT